MSKPIHAAKTISPKWAMAVSGLARPQLAKLRSRMREVAYPARAILFREGEPSETLFVIREGRVRLYQTREDGEEFTYGICESGTLLGLAALVAGKPGILSAQALDPLVVSLMRRSDVVHCAASIPKFQENLSKVLATLALESISRSGPMALDPAAVRLAIVLRSLAHPVESDPCHRRHQVIGLSHEELGKMIGASRTWVGIALAEFERLGLIEKGRISIVIKDARQFACVGRAR